MAQIPGAVNLTGMIAPTDSQDVYPTHSSEYGLGGYREVVDQTERDSIPLQRRTYGMMVFQQSDGKIYQLGSGLTNSDWSEFVLTSTTDDLVEGSTNLYYTDARVQTVIDNNTSGFLTSYTETDPIFSASDAASITSTDISNWKTAHGWGDHGVEGYATETYVNTQVANLVDTAPAALDTLNELAAALGDDPNFATTVTNNIATKVSKSGDTMTGPLVLSGPPTLGSHAITKDYVDSAVNSVSSTVNSLVTDDISEGSINLWYTDARVDARIPTKLSDFTNDVGYLTSETDSQTLTFNSPNLTISNGNSVDLSALLDDTNTTYSAGSGLNLTGTEFSIDNTVALKTELFSGDYSDLTNIPSDLVTVFDLEQYLGDSSIDGTIGNTVISRINRSLDYAKDYTDDEIAAIVIPTNISSFTNDSGYITGYTETDPTVPSHVKSITTTEKSNWNTAFGWGDHSTQGYLTSETDPIFAASDAASITSIDIGNWNTAYGWGDHSVEGYATETYVNTAVANVIDTAPTTLDTLNELAAALGDDPNFATTITNAIATKADSVDLNTKVSKSGDTMTGGLTFGNNNKLTLGGFNALQLYATGTNSLVFNNIGDLYFYNNVDDRSIIFRTDNGSGGTANYIIANGATGSVELTHYGTEKFKTTSSGGELSGNLVLSAAPTANDHAVRKDYVDNALSSVSTAVGNLDTDDVPEGTSNLYYTDERSRESISVSGSLGYNSNTGVISYTQPTNVSAFTNDSGYLTSYTETDPTVPSHVKSITTTEKSNWNTAFGWGDHSTQGYLTSYTETDPIFTASDAASITSIDIGNWNTAYGWGDHSTQGYLTSYTETDPTVPSHVKSITTTEKSNWNTAFGWGDHSTQGYLTSETDSQTLTFNSPNLSISNGNTVDLSALLDDTDTNTYLQSLGFNLQNGVLTATLNDSSTVTVDLDGRYSTTDTTYSQATSTTLGLVKVGYSENGKNYPVELSNGQMFVNVPWTDTNTDTDNYVDSVAFNTTNGILTLGRTGALANLTVDLDGRYSTTDTNTTYSAGSGLNLTGTEFSIDNTVALKTELFSGDYSDLTNKPTIPTIPTNVSSFTNDAGYLTSHQSLTNYATKTYADNAAADAVANIVDTAPAALDTLNELAAALGDDPNFATTVSTDIGTKVSKTSAQALRATNALTVSNDTITIHKGDGTSESVSISDANTWRPIHDTPVNGATTTSISSNWAFDNVKTAVPSGAVFTDTNTTYTAGNGLQLVGTEFSMSGSYSGTFTASGDICAYGTVSDRRQKENVIKLENALDKVNQLNGYTFNYIGKEDRMTGVMAQEVAEVLPEAVFETKAFGAEESTMAVRHGNMVGLLIEAIKELTEQNRQMAEEIKQLKNKP